MTRSLASLSLWLSLRGVQWDAPIQPTQQRARGLSGIGDGNVAACIPTLPREKTVAVSLSLTLARRDKPLLMEEINFGLNRSRATL